MLSSLALRWPVKPVRCDPRPGVVYRVSAHAAADLPKLSHQRYVRPLFPFISTEKMHYVLEKMTGFYTRYFHSTTGEQSAQWLHDHIAEVGALPNCVCAGTFMLIESPRRSLQKRLSTLTFLLT